MTATPNLARAVLRRAVTDRIERGEAMPVVGIPAPDPRHGVTRDPPAVWIAGRRYAVAPSPRPTITAASRAAGYGPAWLLTGPRGATWLVQERWNPADPAAPHWWPAYGFTRRPLPGWNPATMGPALAYVVPQPENRATP